MKDLASGRSVRRVDSCPGQAINSGIKWSEGCFNRMSIVATPSQIYSYGMATWFLDKLTNYKWSIGSSGAGARPGSSFSIDDVNNVLHGSYDGLLTEPQLTFGKGEDHWTVPLYIYSNNDYQFSNGDSLKWANRLQNKWVSTRDYQFNQGDKVKTYYPNIPYVTINELSNKTHQWLGTNEAGAPSPSEKPVNYASITDPNRPGPQLELINSQGLADDSGLNLTRVFESNTNDIKLVKEYTAPAQSQGNRKTSITFRFDAGNEAFEVSYGLTNSSSTTVTQTLASTSSHTVANKWDLKVGAKAEVEGGVPFVADGKLTSSVKLAYEQAYTDLSSNTSTDSTAKNNTKTETDTIKFSVNTSGWKNGQQFTSLPGLTSNASAAPKLSDFTMQIGSEYTITFDVTRALTRLSAGGSATVSGKVGPIRPETLFWNVNGDDERKSNYDTDLTTAIVANNIMDRFLDKGGAQLFDLHPAADGSIAFEKTEDGFKIPNSASTDMSTDVNAVYVMRAASEGSRSSSLASSALRGSNHTVDPAAYEMKNYDQVIDLERHGSDQIGDHYSGSDGHDYVLGDSPEGGDLIETFDGNDYVSEARESSILTGSGNDRVILDPGHVKNYIEAGDGRDQIVLNSIGNVVRDGAGRDSIRVAAESNTILLDRDSSSDKVRIARDAINADASVTTIHNFEIGEDIVTGLPKSQEIASVVYDGVDSILNIDFDSGASVAIYLDIGPGSYNLSNGHELFLAAMEVGAERQALKKIIKHDPHGSVTPDSLAEGLLAAGALLSSKNSRTLSQYADDLDAAMASKKSRKGFVRKQAKLLLVNDLLSDFDLAGDLVGTSLADAKSVALTNDAWTLPEAYSYALQSNLLSFM